MSTSIRIAVVGMGFGRTFIPLYQAHPHVSAVGICDGDAARLRDAAAEFPEVRTHQTLAEVIGSGLYDAVHVLTRVDQHAGHCIQVMNGGLHCASAVPMGLSLIELEQVLEAQRRSAVRYMMMETAIYTAEYLYAKELHRRGDFGTLQFLQGYHSQDLSGLPAVWRGFPPMWYITHALSPLLDLASSTAKRVFCLSSGYAVEGAGTTWYQHPAPLATAIFRLREVNLAAQITRTLFDVAPYGSEGFNIWGSKRTLVTAGEAGEVRLGPPSLGASRDITTSLPASIPRPDLLPVKLRPFASGGHGGSHPHLVHEFIMSLVEQRPSYIDAVRAANWCAPGICAHQSMLRDGEGVDIPLFT